MSEAPTIKNTGEARLLYIHRDALGHLACRSEHMAWKVSMLLLNTRLARQAEHRVSQLHDLGAVRDEFVEAFVGPLVRARNDSFTSLGVSYRPKLPYLAGGPRPLMEIGEEPYATCSDGTDYYHIAKDRESAFKMWGDDAPTAILKDRVSRGEVSGLTFISGDNLIAPEPEMNIPAYTVPIDLHQARAIEACARNDALTYRLPEHVNWAGGQIGGFGPDESDVVTALMNDVFPRELHRPSF